MSSHSGTGYQLNKMDNRAFETEAKMQVEMDAVAPSNFHGAPKSTGGCSDSCFNMHQQQQQGLMSPKQAESPWHPLKTNFLIGAVVCLVIWIVVYALFDHFTVL